MLGTAVCAELAKRGVAHVSTDIEVDIADEEKVKFFWQQKGVACTINCAAYTQVDAAELEFEKALRVNALGPQVLGRVAEALGGQVFTVSTDYVFAGNADTPYTEEMPVAPLNAYGVTKAEGEKLFLQAHPRGCVVRTAWLYGHGGKHFVGTMLKLFATKQEVRVVCDQQGAPTFCGDLAQALVDMALSGRGFSGVYHFTNAGTTTWQGFAQAVLEEARVLGYPCLPLEVKPISSLEYPTPAKRPSYSVLDTRKIQSVLQWEIPHWRTSLKRFLNEECANKGHM
jgi:dTDP-4-dehydrorhamnose reductase